MKQGLWEYDVQPCIDCGSSDLRFREVNGIDFAESYVL
jgi:hypothetical protein